MTGAPAGETATALVHRLAGQQALARGHRLLDPRALEAACARDGLGHDGFFEAATALAEQRILNVRTFGPSLINLLRLTEDGFRQHLVATRSDIDGLRGRILDALREEAAQKRLGEALALAGALGEPALLVEVLLDELRDRGEVVFTPIPGGRVRIHRVGAPPQRSTRAP